MKVIARARKKEEDEERTTFSTLRVLDDLFVFSLARA